jgi:hypothetical protein
MTEVQFDEESRPVFSFSVPGGPRNVPKVVVPKVGPYERGSAQDRAGLYER